MRSTFRRIPQAEVVAAAALLAFAAVGLAACGDDDEAADGGAETGAVEAVAAPDCGPVEYEGEGEPDVLIASDLPMQGASAERSEQMVDAIRIVLESSDWRAGETAVAFQACDDSIAKTGEWDPKLCRDNASAYAANADLVGVIGTYNSGCAAEIIPILNEAPDGAVAMVSPGNTYVCLTEPGDICKPSEPDSYYPSGDRNYVRVVPNDAAQGAGLAEFARAEGIEEPFVLYAADDPTSLGQATTFRNAAEDLGMKPAGFESWDPEAKDYTDLMEDVERSGADAIILAGLLEQNGPQLIEDKVSVLGPNDGKVKLLAPDGFAQQATIDDSGQAAAGMFASVPGRSPEGLPPVGADLVEQLEEDSGDVPVELYAPYSGAAAEVMLAAIEAGGEDRSAVIDGVFETELEEGIVGAVSFKPSGDPAESPITVSVAEDAFAPVDEVVPPADLISAARGG